MQNLLQGRFSPIDATSENWKKRRKKGTKKGGNGEIINTLCWCSRVMLEEWGVPKQAPLSSAIRFTLKRLQASSRSTVVR
jgi:hypothetical protein